MRLALLADLHFGTVTPDIADALLASLRAAEPDRVVIAGDFVQRARAAHFRPASAFLGALPCPWDAVPGNHDLPLWNLPERLAAPRAAYRRWIAPDTEFVRDTGGARLIGLDTTTRWRHQRGNIDAGQIARVGDALRGAAPRLPVILAHHPFRQRAEVEKRLMRGAADALSAWSDCPPHLVLTGHLHQFLVEPFVARRGAAGRTLQVHCGTSASTRQRGAPNDYALIEIGDEGVSVMQQAHTAAGDFSEIARYRYEAQKDGWHKEET